MAFLLVLVMMLTQTSAVLAADGDSKTSPQSDPKYTWNLGDIYKDQQSFDADYQKLEKQLIPEIKKYVGKLGTPAVTETKTRVKVNGKYKTTVVKTYKYDNLLKALKLNDTMGRVDSNLYVYAHLMLDLNIVDQKASDLCAKTEGLDADVIAATAFMEPEILQIPENTLKTILADKNFAEYKHYFDSLLKKKSHKLSKNDEELLAKVSDALGKSEDIYNNIIRGDRVAPTITGADGKEIKLTDAAYSKITESSDRELRKKAFKAYMNNYGDYKNSCASTLNSCVKEAVVTAELRNYESSLDAALTGDFIPTSVFDNLLNSVNKNLPYLHRYYELRRNVMNLDKVHSYDMNVPMVNQAVVDKMTFPYETAKETVLLGLKPLGTEYVSNVKLGFDNRWLDVYPRDKKYDGGYNWGTYDTHPFVLLNYDDSLDEMLTIAHEMGHAMNSVYTNKTQAPVNANQSIFTAEVASTANELLMMDYLIKNAKNDDEKLYLLNQQIDNIRGTVYTQVLYSEFEKYIHEKVANGESLTAKALDDKWLELTKKYNGAAFEADDESGYNWARIPHFYTPFYVYKYATSMSAAFELVKQMQDQGKPAIDKYMTFLKSGNSDYPVELLKKAGVDMTSTKPVDNLLDYFNSLVIQMEQILRSQGKIK